MKKKCKACGKMFDDNNYQFCSQHCAEIYAKVLKKKLNEAIQKDNGHTQNLS